MRLFELLAGVTKGKVAPSTATLYAWGFNTPGIVGDNSLAHRSSPTQIGSNKWKSVTAGGAIGGVNSAGAIRDDGTLWTWGSATNYNLGDGPNIDRSSPVQIAGGGSWSFIHTNKANMLNYGIKTDGSLWGWGTNYGRNLGTTVLNPNPSWICLDSMGVYVMGIKPDKTLWMWGTSGSFGALHANNLLGDFSPNWVMPTPATYLANTVLQTLGTYYVNATTSFTQGYIQGFEKVQFGPGPAVLALANVSPYANGYLANNYVVGWGYNSNNLLRSTTLNQTVSQVTIQWDQPVTNFWASKYGSSQSTDTLVYMKSAANGTVYGYGFNFATLGNTSYNPGSFQSFSSPVIVMASGTYGNVVKISVGTRHSLALTNTGNAYAWGYPSYSGYAGYNVTHVTAGANTTIPLRASNSQNGYNMNGQQIEYWGAGNTATKDLILYFTGPDQFGNFQNAMPVDANTFANLINSGAREFHVKNANNIGTVIVQVPGTKKILTGNNINMPGSNTSIGSSYMWFSWPGYLGYQAPGPTLAQLFRKLTSNTYSNVAKRIGVSFYRNPGSGAPINTTEIVGDVATAEAMQPPSMNDNYSLLLRGNTTNQFTSYDYGPGSASGSPTGIYTMSVRKYGYPSDIYAYLDGVYVNSTAVGFHFGYNSNMNNNPVQDALDFVTAFSNGATYTDYNSMSTKTMAAGGFYPNNVMFTQGSTRYQLNGITNIALDTNSSSGPVRPYNPYSMDSSVLIQCASVSTIGSVPSFQQGLFINDLAFIDMDTTQYNSVGLPLANVAITVTGPYDGTYVSGYDGTNFTRSFYWLAGKYSASEPSTVNTSISNGAVVVKPPETPNGEYASVTSTVPTLIKYGRWANGTTFTIGTSVQSIAAGNNFSMILINKSSANLVLTFGNNAQAAGRSMTYTNANDVCIPTVISYVNGAISNTGGNWLWVDASGSTGYIQNGNEAGTSTNALIPNNAMFFTGNNSVYQAASATTANTTMQPTGWNNAGTYYKLKQDAFGISGANGGHIIAAYEANGVAINTGYNNYYQFGTGIATAGVSPATVVTGGEQYLFSTPVQVGVPYMISTANASQSWTSVATVPGDYVTFGIHADKTLYTWGNNSANTADVAWKMGAWPLVSRPTQISTASFTQIIAAGVNSNTFINPYAIKTDGTLWTWGIQNLIGITGRSGTANAAGSSTTMRQVWTGDVKSWKMVAPTMYTTFGIAANGTLWAWGVSSNAFSVASSPMGKLFDINLLPWTSSSSTNYNTIDTTAAGVYNNKLYVWGKDYTYGRALGLINDAGDTYETVTAYPTRYHAKSIFTDSSWSQVAVLDRPTMAAIKTDGTLWTWGGGDWGERGNGSNTSSASPVQVAGSWSQIVGAAYTFYGVKTDGTVWGWGNSPEAAAFVSIANGYYYASSPVQLGGGITGVSKVLPPAGSMGENIPTTIMLKTDGTLWGYGGNYHKIISSSEDTYISAPVQINTSTWANVQTSVYNDVVVGIKTDGTLWGWGSKFKKTSSASGFSSNFTFNTATTGIQRVWTKIEHVNQGYMGLTSTGELYAWGFNASGYGALGLGARTVGQGAPRKIGSTTSWTQFSLGTQHAAAIRPDGSLWTWGLNSSGQLGLNDTVTYASPKQVGTSSWTAVAAGPNFTLAIKSDGSLWTWGFGGTSTNNILGDNGSASRSSPVQLMAGNTFTKIAASTSNSKYAIQSTGALWWWGYATAGESGLAFGIIQGTTPSKIGTSSWTQVAAGYTTVHMIRTDGALFASGNNSTGQLGDGTVIHKSAPVQIGTSSWTSVWSTGALAGPVVYGSRGTSLFAWGNLTGLGESTLTPAHRSSPVAVAAGGTQWATYGLSVAANGEARVFANTHLVTQVMGATANISHGNFQTLGTAQPGVWETSPVQLAAGSWTQVGIVGDDSSGNTMIHAIRTDGSLWTWGHNEFGQLGDGTVVNKSSPVQIGTSSWAAVSSGGRMTLRRDINNRWFMSGRETITHLYPGGTADKVLNIHRGNYTVGSTYASSPVQVGNVVCSVFIEPVLLDANKWIKISASQANLFNVSINATSNTFPDLTVGGIKDDYTLWIWGTAATQGGQYGTYNFNSNTTILSSPTQVGSNTDLYIDIATGPGTFYVLKG